MRNKHMNPLRELSDRCPGFESWKLSFGGARHRVVERYRRLAVVFAALALASLGMTLGYGMQVDVVEAHGKQNMVATVHPLATDAALHAFDSGGNAVDAAVAAALTLGVVDSFNSGLGGGCFVLIRTSDGQMYAIDGREMAPAKAHRDMYLRDGKPDGTLSQSGPLAMGTPGAPAALEESVRRFGRLKFSQLVQPAAQLAREGFPVNAALSRELRQNADELKKFGGAVGSLLKDDGSGYNVGETIIQKDLAATYQAIADQGVEWFYHGQMAQACDRWFKENGGILSADDFANYHIVQRDPLVPHYRGYTIVGFPPPSSGGIHVAQILNILEEFDLKSLYQQDPALAYHVIGEAMKLAFADRAFWLGDADFVDVPRGLVNKEYAAQLASRIQMTSCVEVPKAGQPTDFDPGFFRKHTTHIATADAEGNCVALTTTVNTSFGSKVIVPGTGLVLNNQMDDFSISPGTPNAFGLIGAENNAIAPGKRPLSSMSPTIVLKDGRPVFVVGAAGGPTIISQVVLAIVRRIDFGMTTGEAIASPRIHHQWVPDILVVEQSIPDATIDELKRLGHAIRKSDRIGVSQAIGIDPANGELTGVADPRAYGRADGR